MFDFVRKKKGRVEFADAFRTEKDARNTSRHCHLPPSEVSSKVTKKRTRYFSVPFVKHEHASMSHWLVHSRRKPEKYRGHHSGDVRRDEYDTPKRPDFGRARSSSCSAASYTIRNPFRQYSSSSAVVASHESLPDCNLSPENLHNVPIHAPVVVSPRGQQADVFFPFDNIDMESGVPPLTNPLANWVLSPTRGIVEPRIARSKSDVAAHPLDRNMGIPIRSGRASVDYLQVSIPGSTMSPIAESSDSPGVVIQRT